MIVNVGRKSGGNQFWFELYRKVGVSEGSNYRESTVI